MLTIAEPRLGQKQGPSSSDLYMSRVERDRYIYFGTMVISTHRDPLANSIRSGQSCSLTLLHPKSEGMAREIRDTPFIHLSMHTRTTHV